MEKTWHCSSPAQYNPNSETWWWQHHAMGLFFLAAGTGRLVAIEGKINALFQSALYLRLGRRFTFQQDNDPKHTAKITNEWLRNNSLLTWPKPNWASLERPENGCPPTFTIQPDRTGEDLLGRMAEDPQIQVWKSCCINPKKNHGCTSSKGCFYSILSKGSEYLWPCDIIVVLF